MKNNIFADDEDDDSYEAFVKKSQK